MTEEEAIKLLRQHLPAEQLPGVLEALAYPVPRDPRNFLLPDLEYHAQVKVPWFFQVEADSPEEAEELIARAVKKRQYLYSSEDGEVQGSQQGDIEIVSNVYLPVMTEGDDAAEGLLNDLGLL
jgi:hypothetical protein